MTVTPLFFLFVSIWNWVDFLAIGCKPRSGRPATAATRETKDKTAVLIRDGSWKEVQLVTSERYVQRLTLRRLMSYIYIYIYIYMKHLFLMFLDHTQRRSTVGRTPLDE